MMRQYSSLTLQRISEGHTMAKRYGVAQVNLRYHRELIKLGYSHDYVMQQLAQTYRTKRAMYTITSHNKH